MKPRGPRKPGGPGSAYKEIERTAALRKKMDAERQRHRSAKSDLALQRQQAALDTNPASRSIQLMRIATKEIQEDRRHRNKMAELTARINKKP